MSFRIRFSKAAVQDIQQVLTFTLEEFGERQYQEYRELIRLALADIASNPLRPTSKHRPELHRNARTFHISRQGKRARHFLIYRIMPDKVVDVARLLHDSMDLRRHVPRAFRSI